MLQVNELNQYYGGSHILRGVNFEAVTGEVTCLLGRNGVGKTTLLKCLMGLIPAKTGEVIWQGKKITHSRPYQRVQSGVAYVPQGREIFPRLTVEENLAMGAFFSDKSEREQQLAHVLELFPRLKERFAQRAGTMSGGEQQMLAVARILRTGANLLLLDEISEGLAPVIVQALARMITTLRQKGYTVVMVEQNFRFAAPLADRFYVMEHGRIVEQFGAAELEQKMPVLTELLGV